MSVIKKRKQKGSADRLRLSVFKSNTNIYAQIIDDQKGQTVLSQSSMKITVGTGVAVAEEVGRSLAEKAVSAGVKSVWFDRGKYKFTGRVKALAEAARKGGLEF